MPSVLFAGSCVAAGALAFFLPETMKLPMPDTVLGVGNSTEANKEREDVEYQRF